MTKHLTKFILLLMVMLLLCGCNGQLGGSDVPDVTPTPVPTPVPLDGPIPMNLPTELTDGDPQTWVTGALTLNGGERMIGALYLEWSHVPETWYYTADGYTYTVEADGYLHQYVKLHAPATEIVIDVESALCDIYAFEPDSRLPDWVQIWQPAHEQADLLLLPTHGDDEFVFFGGMIPYYAGEKGLKVQVAYLTNHWSQILRPHEILDALWHAGLRNYPVIGPFEDAWADSLEEAEAIFSRYDAAVYLTEQIRRFKPSVVIGHDLLGEYGHGQHVLQAVSLTDAIVAAADESIFPESAQKYGAWNTPKMYLHLYGNNEIIMDWNVPLNHFGGKTAMDIARESFALHESQQGFFYVYGEGDDWDSRRFGLYRSTVGADVSGGDVFENITSFY